MPGVPSESTFHPRAWQGLSSTMGSAVTNSCLTPKPTFRGLEGRRVATRESVGLCSPRVCGLSGAGREASRAVSEPRVPTELRRPAFKERKKDFPRLKVGNHLMARLIWCLSLGASSQQTPLALGFLLLLLKLMLIQKRLEVEPIQGSW